jgi:Putative zinc-finger
MTINATNSSKERMDCARVAQEEILEAYLLGRLNEEDREAFEEHYFECAGCFDELQTVRAVCGELARVRTEPDLGTHQFFQWGAVAAFGTAAIIALALAVSLYHPASAPSGIAESRASSPRQSHPTESPSRETNGRTEPVIEQKSRSGDASRLPVLVPVLPAPPIAQPPTPQPSNQSGSPAPPALAPEPSLGGPADGTAKARASAAEQAREQIGQLVNNYCSALESLQPTRVRSLFRLDNERELKAKFKEYKSLRCTVTSSPEYFSLDAGPGGSAWIEFGMKQVIQMASGGAPDTQEAIVTMVVSRRDSQSSWLIDRVTYRVKAK